ncbi:MULTISPECIES: hypothetical protein [Streptomyces]|uniref:hypothetical protein n=1 Tax=Streptomyces TaxID=1883 RepID=UPI0007201F40|nr:MULTISPECIES: hypothetical protein [unclassified Streptomyces]ALM43643.1 hypothetical protein SFR_7028 [Streptomyces sp. FR-008]KAF0794903.1 hypothetical protein P405_17480 [Streptomyces sp. FR-008]MBT2877759.1 hypothetical protein [Streptomyces sp. McG6]MBT2887623.1 hypothetical protein [Streptomyces sp. McG5]MBT2889212.1 hypothetical protein [Streptomyces sp. McG2]
MDKLQDLAVAIVVAIITWGLTTLARRRADREAERTALQDQADTFVVAVAVADVQAAASVARQLYKGWPQRAAVGLLAALAAGGAAARTRALGATDNLSLIAGLGATAPILSSARQTSQRYTASIREPMHRLATAAAPLLRHPDEHLASAADDLFNAVTRTQQPEVIEAAPERFARELARVLRPRRLWRHPALRVRSP